MKQIAILGSTGSIGTQALSVVREHGDISVVAMSCGSNVSLFEQQIREFEPRIVSVGSEEACRELKTRIGDLSTEIHYGMEGLLAVAACPEAEIVLTAIVGMLGIRPTIAAIEAGKDIALANKETLVCAGHLIMPLARKKGVSILPVDSEHSAIFQSLQGNQGNAIAKILLTASGGPFRGRKKEELADVRVEEALAHPNWSMGPKITIDSATMVNKGLEVMEASHLFGVGVDRIEVVVHPESIIHSAVEYEDGAVIAQLGCPDMRLPIQYALYYPHRRPLSGDRLDLFKLGRLSFEKPDYETFTGLSLALSAFREGGNAPTIFNAANEKAVALFLEGRISFAAIGECIEKALEQVKRVTEPGVEEILETEQQVYEVIASGGDFI
ncbi:MAG: 1-deoxy-D-xylulose-5-phosphate reductoisomerase [Lachnospiraceae bacterium]|nr:1-deoxy-D-xylulose-5-phosphate reductoisomerase [Lachnospiraceae bacterium]